MAALVRRWWLVLLGLLLTAGVTVGVYLVVKPTYEITASVLLLPPKSSVPAKGNPYLQLGGLRQAVDLVGVALTDQATLKGFESLSKDAEIEVGADVRTSGPILAIKVSDHSPEIARDIRDQLLDLVPSRLDRLQQSVGVPVGNRVTSSVLTADGEAEEVGRDQLRAALVAGVGGVGLTAFGVAMLDGFLLRRRARKVRRAPRVVVEEPGEDRQGQQPEATPADGGGALGQAPLPIVDGPPPLDHSTAAEDAAAVPAESLGPEQSAGEAPVEPHGPGGVAVAPFRAAGPQLSVASSPGEHRTRRRRSGHDVPQPAGTLLEEEIGEADPVGEPA